MILELTNYEDFLKAIDAIEGCENAYLSKEYYEVFCKTYKQFESRFLAFRVENKSGNIIGVFPLVKEKFYYSPLGYRYSNYLGYICAPKNIEEMDIQLRQYIYTNHKNMVVMYYDINDQDVLYEILKQDVRAKSIFLYNCPFCSVDDSFENVFSRQITKSKKRTEIRKFEKKLQRLGSLKVYHIEDVDSWNKYSSYFSEIFEVHKKRFSKVFIPSELCLYKNQKYYTELFENLVKHKKAYISIMTLDDKVISFVYTVVSGDIIQDWMPAFDPAFSKYNLGTVHLMKIIEYICEKERYSVFDFSKGNGVYKERWCNGHTKNYMYIRRFSNSMIANIKQMMVYIPYEFKGWLRTKGYMSKIKKIIAKVRKQKDSEEYAFNNNYEVIYVQEQDDSKSSWTNYSYVTVRQYAPDIQQALLSAYYTEPYKRFMVREDKIYVS